MSYSNVVLCDSCGTLILPSSNAYSTIPCPVCGTLTCMGNEAKGYVTITSPTVDCEIEERGDDVEVHIPNLKSETEKALKVLHDEGWKVKFTHLD